MARKTARKSGPAVKETAQQIYLAGLGALAKAGEEGSRLFDELVERGNDLERTGRARVEQALGRVRGLRTEAQHVIGRVTSPLDEGMTTAMHKLGVPTRREIQALTRRVEELTRVVEQRGRRGAKAAKAARRTRKSAR
jgi:poly(hydroxyalkanoate) granule-associated protein